MIYSFIHYHRELVPGVDVILTDLGDLSLRYPDKDSGILVPKENLIELRDILNEYIVILEQGGRYK